MCELKYGIYFEKKTVLDLIQLKTENKFLFQENAMGNLNGKMPSDSLMIHFYARENSTEENLTK